MSHAPSGGNVNSTPHCHNQSWLSDLCTHLCIHMHQSMKVHVHVHVWIKELIHGSCVTELQVFLSNFAWIKVSLFTFHLFLPVSSHPLSRSERNTWDQIRDTGDFNWLTVLHTCDTSISTCVQGHTYWPMSHMFLWVLPCVQLGGWEDGGSHKPMRPIGL